MEWCSVGLVLCVSIYPLVQNPGLLNHFCQVCVCDRWEFKFTCSSNVTILTSFRWVFYCFCGRNVVKSIYIMCCEFFFYFCAHNLANVKLPCLCFFFFVHRVAKTFFSFVFFVIIYKCIKGGTYLILTTLEYWWCFPTFSSLQLCSNPIDVLLLSFVYSEVVPNLHLSQFNQQDWLKGRSVN